MSKSAEIVLKKCLGLKKNEKVLIITDSKLYEIAKVFFKEAKKMLENQQTKWSRFSVPTSLVTNNVKLIKILSHFK